MCGRFALRSSLPEIARLLGVETTSLPVDGGPRFNIAPSTTVPVCVQDAAAVRRLVPMRWGLIPHWARDAKIAYRTINARAETVADKPAFRSAFRHRRCLVPSDGYYEWQALTGRKQAWLIRARDERPFFMAGLWDRWRGEDGSLDTYTIVTTPANALCAQIHHRMPVILDAPEHAAWLNPGADDAGALLALLSPCPVQRLELLPVSTHVNNPRHDDERCVAPVGEALRAVAH